MRFGVLGPLAVWTEDGTAVAVPEAKVRALLACLLTHRGEPVPVDRIVDEVWPDDPPARPASALQNKVWRLRRTLEAAEPGAKALLVSRPPGYVLEAPPGSVDADRFRALAERARATEHPAARAALLGDALAEWRGPVLADFADEDFVRATAARLEEQRLTALEERAESRLALGLHVEVADDLGDAVALHPLRERLRAVHLRALYLSGRQSEALTGYEEVRARLADELGVGPGPELTALHRAILTRSADLDPTPRPPSTPTPTPTPTPIRTPASALAPSSVPAALTGLIGRDDAVEELGALLRTRRLVTLTGSGGVGKTRLALAAAARATDAFPGGVRLVELAALDRAGGERRRATALAEVREAVGRAVGVRDDVPPTPGTDPLPLVDRIARAVGDAPALLVLDNCEHVVEPVAELAARLLAAAPALRILATSQVPLGLTGEHLREVPPLPRPEAGERLDPAEAARFGAVELFVARATAAAPGFTLDAATADAVAAICRRLDGIPLALEMAATRVRALGVREVAARLDDRFRLLAVGSRDAPARQRTLRSVLDWSWDLLGPGERTVLRRLSVHADGCALDAAEEVCAAGPGPSGPDRPDGRDPSEALGSMDALGPADALGRADALGPMDAFGRADALGPMDAPGSADFLDPASALDPVSPLDASRALDPASPLDPSRALDPTSALDPADVLDHLARLVDASLVVAVPAGGDGAVRYRLLESVAAYGTERLREAGEAESVRAAHRAHYLRLAERAEPLLRGAEQGYWLRRLDEETANLRGALDSAVTAGEAETALRLATSLCWYWRLRGRGAEAERSLAAALAVPGPAPAGLVARATAWLGGVRLASGGSVDPDADYRSALHAYEDVHDPMEEARAAWFLGSHLYGIGDATASAWLVDGALARFEELGDDWGAAAALATRSFHAKLRGDFGALLRDGERSLEIFRGLGDEWGQLQAMVPLQTRAGIVGEYAYAGELHRACLDIALRLGLRREASFQLSGLGRIALLTREYGKAREYHERARRLAVEQTDGFGEQYAEIGLGMGARREGDLDAAETHMRNVLDTHRRMGYEPGMPALILAELGFAAELRGDAERALELQRSGLAAARATGDPRALALGLEGLAGAVSLAGDPARAARLLGAAAAARASVGVPLPEGEHDDVLRVTARARAALGPETYEREYAHGAETGPEPGTDGPA
ncbi:MULTISPECIES: BTAD domain-containing putative transcriptional regulator [unclassified Streptomyces]|uniref:BTAD domain-containing putative transcriptional regulator n=1 Tax=unclassified Streptomyces TaxID=2593676 RepID=UPI001F10F816|nr:MULTISPECIES: BTAD domain-containing putative transcriptional regulator [unclassified Streptomyces]